MTLKKEENEMKHEELLSLKGKVAVVTGAASGIGKGCAGFLSGMGADVVLLDVSKEKGEAAAEEIGSGACFMECDITDEGQCKAVAEKVKEQFGRVDVLVNCAGVIRRKSVVDLTEEDWDIVIDVGLKGTFLVSKHLIPLMASGGGGSIINIGSGWGIKGGPKAAAYCAAKGGIINLTRAMAIDHGPQNIRVNCVSPGDTDTPLLRDEARQLGINEDEWLAESADRPLARLGEPKDIAMAVYFLASDLSSWVSGANLVVDGGGTA
jgi:NAD(P)-dependent dehydrogenase (short-subunit alcohol dehydrogenase family)